MLGSPLVLHYVGNSHLVLNETSIGDIEYNI